MKREEVKEFMKEHGYKAIGKSYYAKVYPTKEDFAGVWVRFKTKKIEVGIIRNIDNMFILTQETKYTKMVKTDEGIEWNLKELTPRSMRRWKSAVDKLVADISVDGFGS